MSAFDTTRPSVVTSTGSMTRFVRNSVSAFKTWNDARKTRRSLKALSARELDDIGLNYGDIDDVARRVSR